MKIYHKEYTFYPQDTATDVKFDFICSDNTEEIRIYFSFSPKSESDEQLCRPQIEQAIRVYCGDYNTSPHDMDWKKYMPIKNLITLSLEHEGIYIGNAHRWNDNQYHTIRTDGSSLGFTAPKKLSGKWCGQIHLHEIISKQCNAVLTIEEV